MAVNTLRVASDHEIGGYASVAGTFDLCPILTIRSDDLDYVHQPKPLDTVIERIQDKLAGREIVEF